MADPSRILLLLAHPRFQESRANRALLGAAASMSGLTVNDLYERYPTFFVDVEAEQALLLAHDIIVFQFPFYWYSCPPLLKQWMDLVLEHGFAFGRSGDRLRNKRLLVAVTAGGPEATYTPTGLHGRSLPELLLPLERSAALCGMTWLEPFVVYGTNRIDDVTLAETAARYGQRLLALREARQQDD